MNEKPNATDASAGEEEQLLLTDDADTNAIELETQIKGPAPAHAVTPATPVRDRSIARKEYYSISEVCDLVDLRPHVLRYWETQFPLLNPSKNRSGNRVYQRKEIKLRSEEHTSELQSQSNLVCRLLLEKKNKKKT